MEQTKAPALLLVMGFRCRRGRLDLAVASDVIRPCYDACLCSTLAARKVKKAECLSGHVENRKLPPNQTSLARGGTRASLSECADAAGAPSFQPLVKPRESICLHRPVE